jgi:hypothetical protein
MKRVFCVIAAVVALSWVSAQAADSTQIKGWISDAMCGAKHAGSGSECVKGCIKHGEKPVFVDEAKKQVWSIDNPDAVKDFYGDHVTITASSDSSKMSVHIDSVVEAK